LQERVLDHELLVKQAKEYFYLVLDEFHFCSFNRYYFHLKNCERICLLIYAEAIGDSWCSASWSRGHAQRDEMEGEIKYFLVLDNFYTHANLLLFVRI
jgi:hypothetical protein